MGIPRNESVPSRHVGFVGRVSFHGPSGRYEPCTFVFPSRFAPFLSGLPSASYWSPILGAGDETTGVVIYPASVACRGDAFLYSADETPVFFDRSVADIVRAVSTEFRDEIETDAMEQATTESYDDSDLEGGLDGDLDCDLDGDDGASSPPGGSSGSTGNAQTCHPDYVGESGRLV